MKILKLRIILNFSLIIALVISFISCLEKSSENTYYINEPAIVIGVGAAGSFQTSKRSYLYPYFSDTISVGDYLIVNFFMDSEKDINNNGSIIKVDSLVSYETLNANIIKIQSGDMTDDYVDSISKVQFFTNYVDDAFFFYLNNVKAIKGQSFDYEIICNEDSFKLFSDTIVHSLYIKAKTTPAQSDTIINVTIPFAFDMEPFVAKYAPSGNNKLIYFNLNYKSGTSQGKETFKAIAGNPYKWDLENNVITPGSKK